MIVRRAAGGMTERLQLASRHWFWLAGCAVTKARTQPRCLNTASTQKFADRYVYLGKTTAWRTTRPGRNSRFAGNEGGLFTPESRLVPVDRSNADRGLEGGYVHSIRGDSHRGETWHAANCRCLSGKGHCGQYAPVAAPTGGLYGGGVGPALL